jgi:transcription termination factor NusB
MENFKELYSQKLDLDKRLEQFDEDVVKTCLIKKYPTEYSKQVFTRLEKEGKIDDLIKKHLSDYWIDGWNESAKISLMKALGWI